ncbi:hypothetical protein VQH23_23900 [Pararoseomonas sp. SCSIO 73927]|uniref:hypothetical protein n=1 Tax=Pararoseomonas sp. SCSIO 73927 TaxID=3114537 RepID=UPI0030D071D6
MTGNALTTATPAAYARLHGVSRKPIYEWRDRGYLVFAGKLVDVAASNAALARAGRSPLEGDTLRPSIVRRLPKTVTQGDRSGADRVTHPTTGTIRHAHDFPGPCSLASLAGVQTELVVALLAHLPMATVRPLIEEASRRDLAAAAELADEDVPPPAGFETWANHPWFQDNGMGEVDWAECEREAASSADVRR